MINSGARIEWSRGNGDDANKVFGKFDPYDRGGTVTFETDDELLEGSQKTYIRGCSR